MNEPERPISEDDLHAYVDGYLGPARRAAIDRYLQKNPHTAERVAAYATQRDRLRAVFSTRAAEPIPVELNFGKLVEEQLQVRQPATWRIAAAIVLALGAGGAGGWLANSFRPAELTGIDALEHEAAANHVLYTADRRHPVELGPGQREDLSEWLSHRLNHRVSPPDLAAIGYRFIGGRLVATEHGAAALFLYDNERADRLSIFVRPMEADETTPILELDVGDLIGCAWIDKGLGYTLIGKEPYKELVRMSEFVRRQTGGSA